MSYIQLNKTREAEIQSCFSCDIEFHYPKDKDHFDNILGEIKLRSKNSSSNIDTSSLNSSYEDNVKRDLLIVLDDVSGLADTSKKISSFLNIARKFKYNCVYIFHTIHTKKINPLSSKYFKYFSCLSSFIKCYKSTPS